MNSKSIFLVIFALCAFLKSFGQETAHTKEIQIFLHTGVNLFGTSSDIKTGMEKSGMADSQTSYFLFSASKTEYPIVYKYPLANLGVSYFFTKRSGLFFNLGTADVTNVRGYDSGYGKTIDLASTIWSGYVNYNFRSKDKKNQFIIGPSVYLHHAKAENTDATNNIKFGLNLSHIFELVTFKNDLFLGFKTDYSWAPKSEIGPFVINPNAEYETTFRKKAVDMYCLSFGLCFGKKSYLE
ncbi:MAG: hypothetical protein CMO01_33240 [Thalassobius sp.]|nr:hypothetical protein [Thalassovita sp.]